MKAMSQAALAKALRQRAQGGDVARARDLLGQAVVGADVCEMTSRAERWRTDLAEVRDLVETPAAAARHGVICREQGGWVVALDGVRVQAPDRVGMHYLATLLTRPGQAISALTLASHGSVPDDASRQDLLDDTARAHYEAKARVLLVSLADAEADGDLRLVDKLRWEIDALTEQIEAARGLGGRPRAFANPAERARTSVRKAIKRAIDSIEKPAPAVAHILHIQVQTGCVCTYIPDPAAPVTWSDG
jgi:hypothetical protein